MFLAFCIINVRKIVCDLSFSFCINSEHIATRFESFQTEPKIRLLFGGFQGSYCKTLAQCSWSRNSKTETDSFSKVEIILTRKKISNFHNFLLDVERKLEKYILHTLEAGFHMIQSTGFQNVDSTRVVFLE